MWHAAVKVPAEVAQAARVSGPNMAEAKRRLTDFRERVFRIFPNDGPALHLIGACWPSITKPDRNAAIWTWRLRGGAAAPTSVRTTLLPSPTGKIIRH